MCFPAMDNLRLGGFFFFKGGREKKELPNKREEGPPDHRMGHGLLFLWTFPSEVFYCFNVVALSPANGGLLIKNTCAVIEIHRVVV